jgi:GPH family glycoside/pentoside/hexuronide:cation symporter
LYLLAFCLGLGRHKQKANKYKDKYTFLFHCPPPRIFCLSIYRDSWKKLKRLSARNCSHLHSSAKKNIGTKKNYIFTKAKKLLKPVSEAFVTTMSQNTAPSQASPTRTTQFAYALPAFIMAVTGVPLFIFIPKFYIDIVGVDTAFVGWMILLIRLQDAVTDPVIGRMSDATTSRYGRRRPWMLLGGPFLGLFLYLLFVPPELSPGAAGMWFAGTFVLLSLAWTVTSVPWEALGPEITNDYHERSSLFGVRDGLLLVGTLLAAALPLIIQKTFGLGDDEAGQRQIFFIFALIFAPLVPLAFAVCSFKIRERTNLRPGKRMGLRQGIVTAMGNKPFLLLLLSFAVGGVAMNLPATLILYYVQYVLGGDGAELYLLLYMISGIVFLPAWIALAKRKGKKFAFLASMVVNTGAFIGVFFLGRGDSTLFAVLSFVSGTGFGAVLALPAAMQADVLDYDELRTGERREGQYIGIWSVVRKTTSALGMGIALPLMDAAGYVPGAEQSDDVVLTIRTLYALLPCLLNIVAIAVLFKYPISSDKHEKILQAAADRKAGKDVDDPLQPGTLLKGFAREAE